MSTLLAVPGPNLDAMQGRTISELLKPYCMPRTVDSALAFLRSVREPVRLIALYKKYLPIDYVKSTKRMLLEEGEIWSPGEIEFMLLVHEKLFPLNEMILDEIITGEYEEAMGRFYSIPVEPFGMLDWEESSPEDYRPGWEFLIWAVSPQPVSIPVESAVERSILERAITLRLFTNYRDGSPRMDWDKLKLKCEKTRGPLKYLAKALDILARDTEYIFLDATWTYPIEATWDSSCMDWLIDEYKEALAYWNDVMKLIVWLEKRPANMWRAIKMLWLCINEGQLQERVMIR